ncbi:MAG: RHS repeat domain-containing protein [Pirellula sp.]|jgi:RHS repeat-associated protein
MNVHPITTPASPFPASPIFDAWFDSIESLTTSFSASVVPTLETTTVTEVALGYHRNQQYSITAMTTSTGAVAERYAYTAYGQPTILNASGSVLTGSAVGNRFTYTGREWDETLGLHHFRARWMSPLAGRFLGRDPIGYEGSEWGLYEYLDGHALFGCDPFGKDWHHQLPLDGIEPAAFVAAINGGLTPAQQLACMTKAKADHEACLDRAYTVCGAICGGAVVLPCAQSVVAVAEGEPLRGVCGRKFCRNGLLIGACIACLHLPKACDDDYKCNVKYCTTGKTTFGCGWFITPWF